MNRESLILEVCETLETLFMLEAGCLNGESQRADISAWDSLQHVNVILELEGRYGVHFEADEVDQLQGVSQIADLISEKLTG